MTPWVMGSDPRWVVRVTANDANTQSVVEAGLDGVSITGVPNVAYLGNLTERTFGIYIVGNGEKLTVALIILLILSSIFGWLFFASDDGPTQPLATTATTRK